MIELDDSGTNSDSLCPHGPIACMRIHHPGLLQAFWAHHPDAEASLRAWFHEARSAIWTTAADVRARYRDVLLLQDGCFAFAICGAKYRLLARIDFDAALAVVSAVEPSAEHQTRRSAVNE